MRYVSTRVFFGAGIMTLFFHGCSGTNISLPSRPSICAVPAESVAALVYPAPNATGVPDTTRTLLFTAPVESIELTVSGADPAATPIATKPTALPSPLPSPLSTSPAAQTSSYFAVTVPPLAPATMYVAKSLTTIYGCGDTQTKTEFVTSGSFETQ